MSLKTQMFIMAQVVGIIIIIVNAVGDFQKKKDKLFFFNALTNILCALQYFLLGAYTGIICCLVAVVRNIVFSKFKTIVPMYIYIIYAIVTIVINIPFIHHWYDLLPVAAILVYAYALRQSKVIKIKKSLIFTGIVGIIYDICEMAYTGLLLNITDLVGGIKGLIDSRLSEDEE